MKADTLLIIGVAALFLFSQKAKGETPVGPSVPPGYTPGPSGVVTSAPGGTLAESDYPYCPGGTVFINYLSSTDQFQATCGAYAGSPVVFGTQL